MIFILFIYFLHVSFSFSNLFFKFSNNIKQTLCILLFWLFCYYILFLISFLSLNLFLQSPYWSIKAILLFYHLFILSFILSIYLLSLFIITLYLFIHFIIITKFFLKGLYYLFLSTLLLLDYCFLHIFCVF